MSAESSVQNLKGFDSWDLELNRQKGSSFLGPGTKLAKGFRFLGPGIQLGKGQFLGTWS